VLTQQFDNFGVALAAATAMQTGKNWIIVRNTKKGYGTGKLVESILKSGDTDTKHTTEITKK